jgi:thioredoxin reductase (NADPH)
MERMRAQSIRYGAEIKTETIESVDFASRPFTLRTLSAEHFAHTVIIATGATAKRLGIPGETEYWQKGISACAVCDGALPIFRNNPLVVIGGGDSACEEASFLSKYGSSVTMLVRRDELRASKTMQKRVFENPKITIMWNTVAVEAQGATTLTGVKVKNVKSEEHSVIDASGLFYAIGHKPNTEFLGDQLEADDAGYLRTQPDSTVTNVEGVFAAGDVKDKVYRQAVTAAGSGCMAALEAEHYLQEQGLSV